ncbi:MAG: thioesterase family protein [Acidobacteria bacterium]|nr:thioesterase family protein [Acidobacteriota bacterium]
MRTTGTPVAYRARAILGASVIADSRAAVRVDPFDSAATLWFPLTDVDPDIVSKPEGGYWRSGKDELADHVTFDADLVETEFVDGQPDDDPHDVTTKRFPTWGDASDLIDLLDVESLGDGSYLCGARSDWRRPVVEGSQILAQAVVAGSRHGPGRRLVNASMLFPRAADARETYSIALDEITIGRTFSTLGVRAAQSERICGVGTLLFDVTSDDLIKHCDSIPDVVGPYDSVPLDMSVTGRDIRVVGGSYTGDSSAPVGPPEIDAWVRFRKVDDDPAIHAGLLAQFTGHMSIAAAMRPHAGIGQDQAHHTLSTAVNAISISIHADVRVDQWLLYHHRSTFAGGGMTHSECRVHDEDGALVASFTVDAMVREFATPPSNTDSRTAL